MRGKVSWWRGGVAHGGGEAGPGTPPGLAGLAGLGLLSPGVPRHLPGGEGWAVGGSRSLHREPLGYTVESRVRLFSRIWLYDPGF